MRYIETFCIIPNRNYIRTVILEMIVTHVCPFMGEQHGGSERYVYNLSKTLHDDYDIHVFTTTQYPQFSGITKRYDVTFHKFYSPITVWNVNPVALMLRSLIESKSDIFHIHSHLYTLSNQAVLAKILTKRKALLQIHGGVGLPPYKTSLMRIIMKKIYDDSLGRFTIKNSDIVSSVSKRDLEYIKSYYSISKSKLRYLPNTVDTDIFHPPMTKKKESNPCILYVGDLEIWKGVGWLMKWIVSNPSLRGNQIKIVFVGQGSLFNPLRELEKWTLANNNQVQVKVLGQIDHDRIPSLMRNAHGLILPSYWEGMPTVILEAMASGIPVISTPVGDVPHIIKEGETGFLIGRTGADLSRALLTIVDKESKAEQITKNALNMIKNQFSLEKVTMKVKKLYSEMHS